MIPDFLPRVSLKRRAEVRTGGLFALAERVLPAMWSVYKNGEDFPAAEFTDWAAAIEFANQLGLEEQRRVAQDIKTKAAAVQTLEGVK